MLTPQQVDAVARNVIGHMTTDPAFRQKMDIDPNSPGAAATLASAINTATSFSPAVTAGDIPAILAAIKAIGQGQPGLKQAHPTSAVLFFTSEQG